LGLVTKEVLAYIQVDYCNAFALAELQNPK